MNEEIVVLLLNLTDAVTITSTVAPRPQITKLEVNPTTLVVSAEFSDQTNYLGHHWHYRVNKNTTDGEIVVPMQYPAFNESVTLNQSDFTDAGTYVLTAFIVKENHQPISDNHKLRRQNLLLANNATLAINKESIYEVLDIDDSQANHSIIITEK